MWQDSKRLIVCVGGITTKPEKVMAFSDREKAAEKALRRLYPTLIKKLSPDVRNELYARDMLTWHEQQTIGERKGSSSIPIQDDKVWHPGFFKSVAQQNFTS